MSEPPTDLLFPYMQYARTEAFGSAFCLTQSGMPAPDPSVLGDPLPWDLDFAGVEALPTLQARLAELHGVDPERVIVTVGASGAMHLCALRHFRGARVVSDVPSYEPFRALPTLLGADGRTVERRLEDGWQIDLEQVARELQGASAAGPRGHVFVTNTHNPSGALLSAASVRALGGAAARAGGVLVSCEVYMQYVPPAERVEAWRLAPNGISIGSLTKAWGLGALRIGWLVLGDDLVRDRAAYEDMSFLAWVDPPTPVLRAAILALERLEELRHRIEHFERTSKPLAARWLAEAEGVRGLCPDHGIICFPRLEGVGDTLAFARFLAREHDVDVVPGEYFGAPGHVRLGFGVPEDVLAGGLERIDRGLAAWRAGAHARV